MDRRTKTVILSFVYILILAAAGTGMFLALDYYYGEPEDDLREPDRPKIIVRKRKKEKEKLPFSEKAEKKIAGLKEKYAMLKRHRPAVPQNLHLIFGMTENRKYLPRFRAVHKLGKNLTQKEITALYRFLRKKVSEDCLEVLELDAVKNEILNVLISQHRIPPDLYEHLIMMYYDKSFDTTWRDYCVQFLGVLGPGARSPEKRRLIKYVLRDSLDEKGSCIPGTALNALRHMSSELGIHDVELGKRAYELAADPESTKKVRVSALQAAAKYGNRKVLDLARKIAVGEDYVLLRMSAVAVIGDMGTSEDIATLEKMRRSTDVRMRTCTKAALKKLKN